MFAMWRVGRLIAALLAMRAGRRRRRVRWHRRPPRARRLRRTVSHRSGAAAPASSATPPPSRPRSAARSACPSTTRIPKAPQAQLAVIRVPATGDRIGVLMVNPGGPGRVGRRHRRRRWRAALARHRRSPAASTWSASTRAASGTPPRRCAAAPTPNSTPTGAKPMADYSPAGVARIEQHLPAVRPGVRRPDRARTSWPTSAPRRPRATWTSCARRWARTRSTTSASRTAPNSAPATPSSIRDRVRAMVLDGAVDPGAGPDRREHPPAGRLPDGVRRLRRRLRAVDRLPARHRTRPSSSRATTSWSTRWCNSPAATSDPRGLSYQDAITGTVNALYTQRYWKFLTSGLLGLQRGTDAGDLLLLADDYQDRDAGRALHEPAGRVHRDPLRRRAVPDRPGRVGRRRPAGARRRRRSWPTASSPGSRPATSARCGRCRRRRRPHAGVLARPRQGRRRVDHPRSGHAVSGRRRPGPARWTRR